MEVPEDVLPLSKLVEEVHAKKPAYNLAQKILREVALGLSALNDAHIIHGDIKPDNVLIERAHDDKRRKAKIIDFDTSFIVGKPNTLTPQSLGTSGYDAPELKIAKTLSELSPAIDVYSLGMIAKLFFDPQNASQIFSNDFILSIYERYFQPTLTKRENNNLLNFIYSTTNENPKFRRGIKEILNHPFIALNLNKDVQAPLIDAEKSAVKKYMKELFIASNELAYEKINYAKSHSSELQAALTSADYNKRREIADKIEAKATQAAFEEFRKKVPTWIESSFKKAYPAIYK